jgi:hypothetical protein
MEATAARQHWTEDLLREVEQSDFPSAAQLDRIERMISTRRELEHYILMLTEKVQGKRFPADHLLDRVERLLGVLQRVDRQEAQ